jgi:hypothetical protein
MGANLWSPRPTSSNALSSGDHLLISRKMPLWTSATILILLLASRFAIRKIAELERKRMNLRKGATGENSVAITLGDFPEESKVINDLTTPFGNLDHIVVGPTGVFVLDTKSWRGVVASKERDDSGVGLNESNINAISGAIGDQQYFWLIEVSLPNLYVGERAKLVDILVEPSTQWIQDFENEGDSNYAVLLMRFPGFVIAPVPDGSKFKVVTRTTALGFTHLFRLPFATVEPQHNGSF